MTRLETRTVTMTEEQWRHLEMRVADAAEVSRIVAEQIRTMSRLSPASQIASAQLDADFDASILTSIRGART